MRFGDTITSLTIADLCTSEHEYVRRLAEWLTVSGAALTTISAREAERRRRELAAAQVRYLLEHDTPTGFYRGAFEQLEVDASAAEIDPAIFLEHLAYPVVDLAGGEGQRVRLVRRGLEGGRVFHSSGTTDPAARKKIYYDATSAVLLREANLACWEASVGLVVDGDYRLLLLIPEQAKAAMPFGSLVADMTACRGARVHWGARFINEPRVARDPTFGVPTAELDFRDNVRPDRLSVARFNAATKLLGGTSVVMGLLPSVYAMAAATRGKRGVAGYLAHPTPDLVGYGGGLKGMGIPPGVRAAGGSAVGDYLGEVAATTGASRTALEAWASSSTPEDQARLDDVLGLFLVARIEEWTGARCQNVYAGAEMGVAFFSVGSLRDLYGADCYRVRDGAPARDIYVPAPAVAVQLRDPIDGTIIARTEHGRPGLLRMWCPYSVSHLHAIESEDLLEWAPIPDRARFRPAYVEGVGLRFSGRAPGASRGGYCA